MSQISLEVDRRGIFKKNPHLYWQSLETYYCLKMLTSEFSPSKCRDFETISPPKNPFYPYSTRCRVVANDGAKFLPQKKHTHTHTNKNFEVST